jgi:hypothetical protein
MLDCLKKTLIVSLILLAAGFNLTAQKQDYAMIYVYRPKSMTINSKFPVIFNKRVIHELPPHSKLAYKIYSMGLINMEFAGNVKIDLEVEHGREYYIKCPNNGVSKVMNPLSAQLEFNNEKLFTNGYTRLEEDQDDPVIPRKNQYAKEESRDNEKPIVKPVTTLPPSDVDLNIPVNNSVRSNTYVLIIGNEDYSSFQTGLSSEVNVDFALNDARIFKEYCNKTLGIPEKQIRLLTNATLGQMNQGIAWLINLAKIDNGEAELILYYSGHGLPDEQSKEPYLIPVDISGYDVTQGIKLKDVYNKLNENPAKRVTVFLDACFSGGARNQALITMKGVRIRPNEDSPAGNMVVFSSSTGEESSGVYNEKQHGYMTYFLLKKLQETKGNVSYKELADFIIKSVQKETALSGKIQTPQLNFSPGVETTWYDWKIK